MTLNEATVAMKHGLPVIIDNKELTYGDGKFTITNLEKYIPKYEKNYSYSAGVTKNGRCIYQLPIWKTELHPEYLALYELFIPEFHLQNLKHEISYFLKNGEDETKIINTVRELINKIKQADE